ncbi:MAG: hypothetical protein JEZ09_01735 [Salinivirgaceae bacterium]|nr:hypothetical protein [Salinivirgaceae bacterium]
MYLHMVDHSAIGAPEVPANIKEKTQTNFGGTIILSGGYDREKAETDLNANKGELVAFGRTFISNPDLVNRMENNIELAVPYFSTFYTPGEKGYSILDHIEKLWSKLKILKRSVINDIV